MRYPFVSTLFRWFLGMVFVGSGLAKLNDPIGMSLKINDYLEILANGLHPVFLQLIPYSLPLGLVIIGIEIAWGLGLCLKVNTAWFYGALVGILLFFASLMFYMSYTVGLQSCGCFGDMLPMTPWTSFLKNIMLLSMAFYLYLTREVDLNNGKKGLWVMGIGFILTLFGGIFILHHLPICDNGPYKIGTHIPSAMKPSAVIKYKYFLIKDNQKVELTTYPSDTSYHFVSMEPLNPENMPTITDFSIWNETGNFTQPCFEGTKFLIVVPFVEKADVEQVAKLKPLLDQLKNTSIQPWVLTASDYMTFENFRMEYQWSVPYFYADATVLKTMVRSNPGLLLLQNGKILAKWNPNDLPSVEEIKSLLSQR